MKVALITRSTFFTIPGGDTIQISYTEKHLQSLGIDASILLTHDTINYSKYDLLHFFNIVRPADIMYHIKKSAKPFVVSPNLVRYGDYDQRFRKGFSGLMLGFLEENSIEYVKTIARWLNGSDGLKSIQYLWKGQKKAIQQILSKTYLVLPNSEMENTMLRELYGIAPEYVVIPNGFDTNLFVYDSTIPKDDHLILCVARIEGIKNQINLIKALNNTKFRLLIIGSYAPNQKSYYDACKSLAASNISFIDHISQEKLVHYYQKAKVHILPSWFETCGLSTLEAAAMGCNVIVTDKGYTREYFGDYALYCNPASPESILDAVNISSQKEPDNLLRTKILNNYTWQLSALRTAEAYNQILL